ncbi:TonB-dependent receptor [Luteibaculum oceani]|uniref:TonB-dependent receptor n=1 Tax=Luteibaculum oceani TaxID=1294296 RepID=A0A5C6URY4_9FLAO|nr:TonB-dependent receptor [Luteibaculum oceani]TXC76073.1 TonB-dependent receptor [Luteibaculum oceani]
MKNTIPFIFLLFTAFFSYSQNGTIKGTVVNDLNNEPIPFANILIQGLETGTTSDVDGSFSFTKLNPGTYNIICSYVGFEKYSGKEIIVRNNKPTTLSIRLIPRAETLQEVEISSSPIQNSSETPVSLQRLGAAEIYRNPGGNRDISKVIQILPGVATTVSFRNDLLVRGGAPNENRFFIDGIEVPNINHFATQGSSGGPVGLLNVNFIRNVDLYTSAFPTNRGNALSSVLDIRQIQGNPDRLAGTFMLGSSDVGITLDGPSGKNSNFILSVRRSYLQFLFKALALPFLPTYNDLQYKHDFSFGKNDRLTVVALAAVDQFALNESVNDGLNDSALVQRNEYILGNLPVNNQWNYTLGAKWTRFRENGNQLIVVSRSHLNNSAEKFRKNISVPANLILDYNSQEIENKFRYENNALFGNWKVNTGAGLEFIQYRNETENFVIRNQDALLNSYQSSLGFFKYAGFMQATRSLLNNRLDLSVGLRLDANSYSSKMSNPFNQFSPRIALSYALNEKMRLSSSLGRYFQLPPLTAMGYKENGEDFVNKTRLEYIRNDQWVVGWSYTPTDFSKISVEGFAKWYKQYPFSLNDSISLANLGADFGVIGTEPVASISEGRSYGLEFFAQQSLSSSIYGLISYTFVRSEFRDPGKEFVASSWDNRHILNITAGKKFKRNWELGIKFRFLGGAPYTPFNIPLSMTKSVWDVTQQGVPDWNRINSARLSNAHGLDIRLDKKWFFEKWSLNCYIDIENLYNNQVFGPPFVDVERDNAGNPIENPNNTNQYLPRFIENSSGTVLPSIGVMVEW